MPKLIAREAKGLRYAGKHRKQGEPFEASERDARILTTTRLASRATSTESAPAAAEARRRTYKRRDLRAED